MVTKNTLADFQDLRGDAVSLENRIKGLVATLETKDDYIEVGDKKCYNEQELRVALKEGGIL